MYVLIIISFVAMGGPKPTTPTIDHIQLLSASACEQAKDLILSNLKGQKVTAFCVGG